MINVLELKDKKIGVLGFSTEGVSTAKYLHSQRLPFTIFDQKTADGLEGEAKELYQSLSERATEISPAVDFRLSEDYLDHLNECNFLLRTPGFPLWQPKLREFREKGGVISSQTKLFFDLCPCPIISVTGTKGKGTTATLIYEMLKSSGFSVYLGGNIGRPPLTFINELAPKSYVVLELSSFQLEDLTTSPSIAVVLMITSDHLGSQSESSPNYHRSVKEYIEAKMNIVSHQKENETAIFNSDSDTSRDLSFKTPAKVYFFSRKHATHPGTFIEEDAIYFSDNGLERICPIDAVSLRGAHNLENVCPAVTVAKKLGVENKVIQSVLETFRGLPHRLEFTAKVRGVDYYNDSFSTTPETAIAAIRSFSEPLILILGGSDKASDYTELGRVIRASKNIRAVILIGVTAGKIEASILTVARGADPKGSDPIIVKEVGETMAGIVGRATREARLGDVVLLSPACASFDMFKNYKDRGDQFKEQIRKLEEDEKH